MCTMNYKFRLQRATILRSSQLFRSQFLDVARQVQKRLLPTWLQYQNTPQTPFFLWVSFVANFPQLYPILCNYSSLLLYSISVILVIINLHKVNCTRPINNSAVPCTARFAPPLSNPYLFPRNSGTAGFSLRRGFMSLLLGIRSRGILKRTEMRKCMKYYGEDERVYHVRQ